MIESELNRSDRERISVDIKLTLIFGTLLVVAIIVLVGLIPFGLFLFGHGPAAGFVKRALFILSFIVLLYVVITWRNLIKYADLKNGKKINFKTADYELRKKKDGLFLETNSPLKLRISLYDDMINQIKQTEPIIIEISKWSKTLLFISHDSENLIERIEREHD